MKGGKMNLNSYLEQIVGLKVLNVTHLLNLTGFVFGLCEAENKERILDNSYGLQIACPWILNDNASGKN